MSPHLAAEWRVFEAAPELLQVFVEQPVHVPAGSCWLHHLARCGCRLAHTHQAAYQATGGLQGRGEGVCEGGGTDRHTHG